MLHPLKGTIVLQGDEVGRRMEIMRKIMRGVALLMVLLGLLAVGCTPPAPPIVKPARVQPNIVVIYTDDQRWDTLCPSPGDMNGLCQTPRQNHPMPFTEGLRDQAVTFTNAIVSNPLCCPSRASLLAGGLYSHHTHVRSNKFPQGGAHLFDRVDEDTIATRLQAAGYATAWIGNKYLNNYDQQVDLAAGTAYIPPGWDRFAPAYNPGGAGDWLDSFSVVLHDELAGEPTTEVYQVSGPDQPDLLDWEREQAEDFLSDTGEGPFFLFYSPWAPHLPALTPPAYGPLYANYDYQGRGYTEAGTDGLGDKPAYIQATGAAYDAPGGAVKIRNQLRHLRWLDANIAHLLNTLESRGLLDNTIIVFASDNGFQWGEHGLMNKDLPYEESLRVPFFIVHPAWEPGTISSLAAVDLDLAPTLLELAGAEPITPADGVSLVGLVADPATPWRDTLLIQGADSLDDYTYPHTWVGVRRADGWKYVEYITGERELYQLTTDPFERFNKYGMAGYEGVTAQLVADLAGFDRPLAILSAGLPDPTTSVLPVGEAGAAYSFHFQASGGTEPYVWSLYQREWDPRCAGEPPAGLALDGATGVLGGTPASAGSYDFCVQVRGAGGGVLPQADYRRFSLTIE